jgi:lysozyme
MREIETAVVRIKQDEGLRLHPYNCTSGKVTIGYGRNLDDVGISEFEADILLRNDVERAHKDAISFTGPDVWNGLSHARRAVIINMAFNLGLTRLRAFKSFHHHLVMSAYAEAAYEMLDSRWARQVGDRAERLADTMRSG